MTEKDRAYRDAGHQDHHLDHEEARQEHVVWKEAVTRWRREYQEAAMAFVRRMTPEHELEEFEAALDRHEAAMEVATVIHEQALDRHESALRLEERGARGVSDEFEELHQELDSRHVKFRQAHADLERRHRAIVEALLSSD